MTSLQELKEALQWDSPASSAIFDCLSVISKFVMEHGASDPNSVDAIIRLRDATEDVSDPAIKDAVFSLCREAGLFPYVKESALSWRDQVAYELFRGPREINYVFHREQWQAFQYLRTGKSLVLSAPTSFGKSVLIHAFIAEKKPSCVVVVVPTIALLDQFRRRLTQFFAPEYICNQKRPTRRER